MSSLTSFPESSIPEIPERFYPSLRTMCVQDGLLLISGCGLSEFLNMGRCGTNWITYVFSRIHSRRYVTYPKTRIRYMEDVVAITESSDGQEKAKAEALVDAVMSVDAKRRKYYFGECVRGVDRDFRHDPGQYEEFVRAVLPVWQSEVKFQKLLKAEV
jgi:hypothetical protein